MKENERKCKKMQELSDCALFPSEFGEPPEGAAREGTARDLNLENRYKY